jgi:formiminotetrahydrofolate cyclodeaminase
MVTGITVETADRNLPGEGASSLDAVREAGQRAERLQAAFEQIETEDIEAFEAYLAALRLPRSTPGEKASRRAARAAAAVRATEAPLRTLRTALETLRLASSLLDLSRTSQLKAESDLGVSIELAAAAFRAAEMNIRVNLPEIPAAEKDRMEAAWREAEREFDGTYAGLRSAVIQRLGSR